MNRLKRIINIKSLFIVKCIFLISLLISGWLLFPVTSSANSSGVENTIEKKDVTPKNSESSEPVGFTVEAVKPETQIDESKGYFYTRLKPGEEQKLTLRIKSTVKEARKVRISIGDAFTSSNGTLDYGGSNYQRDKTLKNSLEEITSISTKEVTVEKLETKEVTITVKAPKEPFKGVKVGAISIMNAETDDTKGVSSSYGYRVGLMVSEEDEIEYNDGASLNFLKVKSAVYLGKRVIQARLQNPEPKVLDNLTVETKLRKKGNKEVLRKRTTSDMRMAPNSQFDFATNWGVDPIKPGTYVLSVKATSNKKSWKWSKEFTIGEEQAKKINEEASYTLTYPKWIPIVVILLGILTITVIGCLYLRRKKWTEQK